MKKYIGINRLKTILEGLKRTDHKSINKLPYPYPDKGGEEGSDGIFVRSDGVLVLNGRVDILNNFYFLDKEIGEGVQTSDYDVLAIDLRSISYMVFDIGHTVIMVDGKTGQEFKVIENVTISVSEGLHTFKFTPEINYIRMRPSQLNISVDNAEIRVCIGDKRLIDTNAGSLMCYDRQYMSNMELTDNKVDKEDGKGLSTNDYTDADKTLVGTIEGKVNLTESGANALINTLTTATATPQDDDYYVSQRAGGSTATYFRRKTSAIWEYIKSKLATDIPAQSIDCSTDGSKEVYRNGVYRDKDGNIFHPNASSGSYLTIGNESGGTKNTNIKMYYTSGNINTTGTVIGTNITTMQNKLDAIGSYEEIELKSDVATSHQTAKSVCSKELPAGTYIVTGQIRWNSNATGVRIGGISTSADSTARDFMLGACPNSYTVYTITKLINLTKKSTLYLNAYHNAGSGVSINVLASGTFLRVFRIA